jgi:PIN domain nuclease of toxin-antitoxin system
VRFLLDTQALLWLFGQSKNIKPRDRDQIIDPLNDVFVSAVSTWEVSIKVAIGKLSLPDGQDPSIYLPASIRRSSFTPLPITLEHTYGVASLAKHHADPFDRLLISQAKINGLTILTSDRVFLRYDVAAILI